MKVWKYSLWTATLFVVSWVICLVSALVAGKGGLNNAKHVFSSETTNYEVSFH
jgi:hypothetical protein